jgi:hypothetical protein
VLFALVAARAIEPASKLATAAWLSRARQFDGTPECLVTEPVIHVDCLCGRP